MATLILWIIILVIIFLPGRKKKKKKKEEQRTQGTAYTDYRDPRQSGDGKSRNQSYGQTSSGQSQKKRGVGRTFRWDQGEDGSSAITFSGLPEGTDELEYLIRRNRAHERALMSRLESRDK